MTARFFIRNDDVWTLDQRFRSFFNLAIDHDIPVVHAVIPGRMDQRLIQFLCRAKEKTPHLLDIVQHGWMHTNHGTEGTKYEFGLKRSLTAQREDIKQGFEKMRLAFGEYFTPAFVPPYHGYDERTLMVLEQEGFKIFSAAHGALSSTRLMHVPAAISLTCYEGNQKSIYDTKVIIGRLAQSIQRRAISGVLVHHADFNSAVTRHELKKFFRWIRRLIETEGWQAILFSEL